MINAGASQSLIKIEAVEIAKIPIGRRKKKRVIMSLSYLKKNAPSSVLKLLRFLKKFRNL
jgi:hypothetical protein